ncbi:MAG: acireductone dioxygenase [Gammaproteobacteria bacterium]|nr:acireductone dioxygenase [Gammaproteobacteria bacterium]
MSRLVVYSDDGQKQSAILKDHAQISLTLAKLGVRFEQWQANADLPVNAEQQDVLTAYKKDVEQLNNEYGFQSVDVVSLRPDHPQKEEMRQKFLAEHVHSDFEVRFFVDGSGLFYLHVNDKVYVVLCEQGDLISVPANTTHWFDMGSAPDFKCIRLFVIPEGWVGEFTGNDIVKRFPTYDQFVVETA